MAPKINVVQPEGEEIHVDVLAEAIVKISAEMARINDSRLNRKALLVLLSHSTGLTQRDVANVVDSLASLETMYCTPKGRRK